MPVSLANSQVIYDALKACDVKIVSALPETWLVHLIRMADDDPDVSLIRVAKEEEAIGISAGAHLAGVNSALLMQNHGFLAAINPIVSLAQLYKIPLLMLISYRGHMGERDPWQTQGGMITEPLLRTLGIPVWHLSNPRYAGSWSQCCARHGWGSMQQHLRFDQGDAPGVNTSRRKTTNRSARTKKMLCVSGASAPASPTWAAPTSATTSTIA